MARPLYVCICGKHMKCKTNEVYGLEMATFGPAALWYGDLWECPECGHQLVTGFGQQPIREHYEEDFEQLLALARESGECYEFKW